MRVKTIGDLLTTCDRATIACMYKGTIVRRLSKTPKGEIVLDPTEGPTLVLDPSTPLLYEPWMMDRGSILFRCPEVSEKPLKLCGEGDPITFADRTTDTIEPSAECEQYAHKVHFNVF